MPSKCLAKRFPRLPFTACKGRVQSVIYGSCSACLLHRDMKLVFQTSQGLAPQLRWLILGCGWQRNPASNSNPGYSAVAAALVHWRTWKYVRTCSVVKFTDLHMVAVGMTVTFLWSQSIWDAAVVKSRSCVFLPCQVTVVGADGHTSAVWQRAKSCAFCLLQLMRNIELKNGIVQGHAYTVTGAEKVRSRTCSCVGDPLQDSHIAALFRVILISFTLRRGCWKHITQIPGNGRILAQWE